MTHTTEYETRDGKTYRVENAPPAAPAAADAPKPAGAETTHTPAKPAKQGA